MPSMVSTRKLRSSTLEKLESNKPFSMNVSKYSIAIALRTVKLHRLSEIRSKRQVCRAQHLPIKSLSVHSAHSHIIWHLCV